MLDPIQATADDLWLVGHHVLEWLQEGHSVAIVTHDGTLDAISLAPVAAETGIPLSHLLADALTADEQGPLIDAISDGPCSRIDLVPVSDPSSWRGHDYIVFRDGDMTVVPDLTGFRDVIVVSAHRPVNGGRAHRPVAGVTGR